MTGRIDDDDLERIGIFEGLTDEERAVANAALKPYVIGAGEELLREGEADRSLLVVVDGGLLISLGDVELARVDVGDIVGEMALFGTFDRRSATVSSTVGPTKLLILDEDALRFLRVQGNPMVRNLEAFALRCLYRRVLDMVARTADLTEPEPPPPASVLKRLASVFGLPAPPDAYEVLRLVPGFASREPQVVRNIADRLTLESAARGKAVTTRGVEMGGSWMVASGSLGAWHTSEDGEVARGGVFTPGHVFGRVGSTANDVATCTVCALEPSWLLYFPPEVSDELEADTTVEAAAYRRGMIDALATQLRMMNEAFLSTVLRSAEA